MKILWNRHHHSKMINLRERAFRQNNKHNKQNIINKQDYAPDSCKQGVIKQNIHGEANECCIRNDGSHRNHVENVLPVADVLRTDWDWALEQLKSLQRTLIPTFSTELW